jgi:cytochrome P450
MQRDPIQTDANVTRVAVDPFSDEFLADPFAFHPQLRDASPAFWLDAIGAYSVVRHDEVTHVLKHHDVFISSRGVGLADFAKEKPFRPPSLLLEADPPLHNALLVR